MSKQVFFQFRDCKKLVGVGMTVFTTSNQLSRGYNATVKETITGIGHKYITVGRDSKYEIESGAMKTEYTGRSIWSSEQAYYEHILEHKLLRELHEITGSFARYGKKFTIVNIKGAMEALGMLDEIMNEPAIKELQEKINKAGQNE